MAADKQRRAFISYSRVNKEFASKLADDLRKAGYPIWFDLFDIPTGSRWDDEVEKALRESSIFMIILTRASIASENVKDEIGYAIDNGKRILPVLLEQCEVPLRLRRFQYVDFTAKSFEEGFDSAKELLGSLVDKADSIPATPVIKTMANVPEVMSTPSEKKPMSKRLIIGISAVALLIIAVIGIKTLGLSGKDTPPTLAPVVSNPATEVSDVANPPTEMPVVASTSTEPSTVVALDIGSTMISEKDGATLVYVPKGEFIMGGSVSPDEAIHTVYLDAFWISQTEVTNKQYQACVNVSVCEPPSLISSYTHPSYYGNPEFDNNPVLYVNWGKAKRYCEVWAGGDLPTEAQWEKAARGTKAFTYPWGEGIDCNKANYQNSCVGDTLPVGSYKNEKSPYGAYDMAGNVWEWVNDWYSETYYQSLPSPNPLGPVSGKARVLRGGSWDITNGESRSANRIRLAPDNTYFSIGFRCAHSLSP